MVSSMVSQESEPEPSKLLVVVVVVIFNVYFRLPWGMRRATSVNLAYKNGSSALTVHQTL